jgi:hypothetical protein
MNPIAYNAGLFEWTYFRSASEPLYLLLIVNEILKSIKELGIENVTFKSELNLPLKDYKNLSLKFSQDPTESTKDFSMIEGEFIIYPDEKNIKQ